MEQGASSASGDKSRPARRGVLLPAPKPLSYVAPRGSIGEFIRVTHALIMREIQTRFGRDNIGFAWILVEPAFFCLAIVLLWLTIKGEHDKMLPIVPFLLTGYLPMLMYRHCVGRALNCMKANVDFLYHKPVTILSLYAARFYVEIFSFISALCVLWVLFAIFGMMELPARPDLFLLGWGVYIYFAIGLSTFIGVLSETSELVDRAWQPLSYITIPISGTFFMVSWLPGTVHEIAPLFPPITAVELIRGGYFGGTVQIYTNVPVAIVSSSIFFVAGLWLMRNTRNYVGEQ